MVDWIRQSKEEKILVLMSVGIGNVVCDSKIVFPQNEMYTFSGIRTVTD